MKFSLAIAAAVAGLVSAAGNATAVVTQIGDGQIQAPPATAPPQANGAVALGVSAAAAGAVVVAALF
ncbi:hypothetical protein CJU90_4174 [Yarrowia sp. C11]|nr:hypothetical protein CKK34_6790 [Yarrowia sp. E02]KAG5365116.1 hypothetical protein CJU90_4174 [Yarrowia sp. C11]